MPREYFVFNKAKAIEAILYLAERITDPTYHSIAKLMYFADKTHLEKFGRFICGDTYFAMEYGPVPTNIYRMLKDDHNEYEDDFVIVGDRTVKAVRAANDDELSESDVICLDLAVQMYGAVPVWKRTQDSHDEAWRNAWENRGKKKSVPITVESIVGLLEEPRVLLTHLQDQNPD